jgi:NAD(P)-dependent dehydrogenase (short-subunit alcohol dehydrogenase family)
MYPDDSVALATGAAAGIGRETALAFARAGCRVVLADRDAVRGEAAAAGVRALGRDAVFVATDVALPGQVEALHRHIAATFGRLDAVCNNAGVEGELRPTAESSLENFDRLVATNLRGVFLCLREQLALMLTQGRGAIVNMASVAGLVGFPGLSAYCAAKGGVVQLTRAAALEYAERGIRINAVCPGAIRTEMMARLIGGDAAVDAQFTALHPMGRLGQAREVADAVVWLCSPQAGFITGQALAVDGGFVAR